MNAKDDELRRLEALVSQYDQHQALRGELVFGAINDDGRLDVATPFFEDADYEALKASGLRDALIGLLDDMIVLVSSPSPPRNPTTMRVRARWWWRPYCAENLSNSAAARPPWLGCSPPEGPGKIGLHATDNASDSITALDHMPL